MLPSLALDSRIGYILQTSDVLPQEAKMNHWIISHEYFDPLQAKLHIHLSKAVTHTHLFRTSCVGLNQLLCSQTNQPLENCPLNLVFPKITSRLHYSLPSKLLWWSHRSLSVCPSQKLAFHQGSQYHRHRGRQLHTNLWKHQNGIWALRVTISMY